MKCALVGSRYFGASVLQALLLEPGIDIACVVAPAADDRLALAAQAAGLAVHVLANPKIVPGEAIADGTELIIAAHTHARVSDAALARARLGGVGYHPSLLPRHRGIAAVEWTIREGDPIAGGTVYHLADGWDAGPIAAQDWCFVGRGETARELWERALAPMGLALLTQVVQHARAHGELPARAQDARYATQAPMLRRSVARTSDDPLAPTSLVVSVIGNDRPGIVSALAERAQRHGANWSASHMARLAGEFAGVVQIDVPPGQAEALTQSLHGLESTSLRVIINRSDGATVPAGLRRHQLDLVGNDRVGIVSQFTRMLAERGISIEQLHTELLHEGAASAPRFEVRAQVLVPQALDLAALRAELGAMASSMVLDIALGDPTAA